MSPSDASALPCSDHRPRFPPDPGLPVCRERVGGVPGLSEPPRPAAAERRCAGQARGRTTAAQVSGPRGWRACTDKAGQGQSLDSVQPAIGREGH